MTNITLLQSNQLIEGTLKKAREIDAKPLGVLVLDSGGNIVAFQREDNASLLRFDITMGKAWGALGMGMNSRQIAEIAEARPTFVTTLASAADGKVIPSAGGVLIQNVDGQVIGAVGVSGDLPDVDEECALAGIQAAGFQS